MDKLATKLKATEEKAKTYEKHIKATADKASALEKDAADSKEMVKVSSPSTSCSPSCIIILRIVLLLH